MAEDRVLGGVGTKLLFENDRVKVWEMALEPGEESAVHRHELDYVMVQVDGDRMAGVSEPDSEGPYPGYIEGDVAPGNVLSAKRGGVEVARNVGQKPFYEIIVELKD
jgi:beta-alanine degradation protein BauB